jgi:hypothetical protein
LESNDIFDVFLSHAHVDAALVERMGVRLVDEAKLSVWLDRWVLVPGESWQQHMAKGLDKARCCAVCIGKQTPKGWFREEIEKALNRQTRDPSFRVIPVILPDGDSGFIDDFLALRTWVDFSGGMEDGFAFHLLLSGIKGVPPGRYIPPAADSDSISTTIRNRLVQIKEFRRQQLIDDDIALEYQRRLLDRLIGEGGHRHGGT